MAAAALCTNELPRSPPASSLKRTTGGRPASELANRVRGAKRGQDLTESGNPRRAFITIRPRPFRQQFSSANVNAVSPRKQDRRTAGCIFRRQPYDPGINGHLSRISPTPMAKGCRWFTSAALICPSARFICSRHPPRVFYSIRIDRGAIIKRGPGPTVKWSCGPSIVGDLARCKVETQSRFIIVVYTPTAISSNSETRRRESIVSPPPKTR